MNNHNLLRRISYFGMIISGIGLILNLLSVFVFSNNLNGVNFKYGFEIPVTMRVWTTDPSKADSTPIKLITAKPFTLRAFGCGNRTDDITSIQNNESSLIAQNRLPAVATELKVKSNNFLVNIALLVFNFLPTLFWFGLFYLTTKMTKILPTAPNATSQYSNYLGVIGRFLVSYELLLLLSSALILLVYGGSALISDASIVNDYYQIHFHPRIIFNIPELLLGMGLVGFATLLRNSSQ